MDNHDDFTFCQVGSTASQDGLPDEHNITPAIGGMTIRDENTNCASSSQSSKLGWEGRFQPDATPMKEETIGSLSFSVIDTSPCQPSESSVQVVSGNPGPSAKRSEDGKLLSKKPAPRSKVPFEKGYSQMDWLKLTRTHTDLAGLNGQSNKRLISMSEVKHQSEGLMWTVLKGRVYNLSPYVKFHPGGVDMLMKAVGKDCTSLFNKYHAWVNADFLLEKCLVGILDDAS